MSQSQAVRQAAHYDNLAAAGKIITMQQRLIVAIALGNAQLIRAVR